MTTEPRSVMHPARRWIGGMALVALAVVLALGGLAATGDLDATFAWAAVAAKVAQYTSLTLAFGYVFVVSFLQPGAGRVRGHKSPQLISAQRRQSRLARRWTIAFVAWLGVSTYMAYANATGALSPARFGYFLRESDIGTVSVVAGAFAVASIIVGAAASRLRGVGWQGALLALSVVALGFLGHAGSSLDHANAVNAMIVHLLGLLVWLGPLVVIALERRHSDAATLAVLIRRYSPWALFALCALAFSGLVNSMLRLSSLTDLVTTGYGAIVLVKSIGTVLIAALGYLQRSRVVSRLSSLPPRETAITPDVASVFARLAATETVVASAIIGLSAALGRSQPPVPQYIPPEEYRVLSLVGFEPPVAPFDVPTLFTQWQFDWTFLAATVLMAGLYCAGYVRLRRRGDAWPIRRLVFFLAGCAAFILVMNAGPAAYGRTRFDAHMVQHMALMVIVPPLWVLGGVVTLMSRAIKPRTDGSRGMREWVLAILHSGYANVVSSPPIAGFLFAGSLVIFYFTPLFTWAMFAHAGHLIMTVHFLLAGYLFAWVIMGVDPGQRTINPALKLVTLLATLSFHAFFGIAVVSASWIIGGQWYDALAMYPPEELAFIQVRGGSIMWGVSEVPTLFYAVVAAIQWGRSDDRRARQYDRRANRDGDAELEAYNQYLKSIEER